MTEKAEQMMTGQTAQAGSWPPVARLGFRFAFLYWSTYCLHAGAAGLVLWLLPGISRGFERVIHWPDVVALWVGARFFHLPSLVATTPLSAAGFDTALQYVLCLCRVVFALAGAAIWTAFDERTGRQREYRTLYAWLRLGMRFTLAMYLLDYGFLKVFDLQFSPLPLLYLTETYGDSSPMRLLWAFMGASVPYTIFGGLAEVVPGVLLLFRRTSTLGALISAGVMLNVVLLNFCYDVPVKLFSIHLLLASLFLLLPDAAPLWRIFLAGQAATLTGLSLPRWERRPLRWASHVLQALVFCSLIYQSAVASYQQKQALPVGHPSLYGMWALDKAEGLAGQEPWAKVLFDRPGEVLFIEGNGKKDWYDAVFDEKARSIELLKASKPTRLQWSRGAEGTLVLTGPWLGDPVTLSLHRLTPKAFPLQTRGFHWIQDYPYNR